MDMETALRYLLVDAQFYNLQGLCDLLTMPPPTVDLSWAGFANDFVNLRDVLDDTLPEGIVKRDDGSVMSEDSDLRVFVYAQDVVMKIVVTTTTFPQLGSQYSRLYESSRIVELSDPTSPTASRTYTPSVLSSDASDSEHSLGFRMDKFFDEGSLNVDGESYSMDSVKRSEALSELHPPIRGSEHDWTLEHFPCQAPKTSVRRVLAPESARMFKSISSMSGEDL